ncbi:MAG: OadG family protein [Bullifex sp.]
MLSLLANLPKDVLVQQIKDGLVLLVLGMGTVFVFLTILIFTTKLLSKVCARIAPAKSAAPVQKKSTAAPQPSGVNKDAEVAAAIAAAYARSGN